MKNDIPPVFCTNVLIIFRMIVVHSV